MTVYDTSRIPLDLTECESELVANLNTEYAETVFMLATVSEVALSLT